MADPVLSLTSSPATLTLAPPQAVTLSLAPTPPAQLTVVSDGAVVTVCPQMIVLTAVSPPPVALTITTQTVNLSAATIGQQGPKGDPGANGASGGGTVTWINGDGVTHTLGQVVYLSGADTVKLAQANDPNTSNAVALVASASVAPLTTGTYQFDNILTGLSGLLTDKTYYLSDITAGTMTAVPPSTPGSLVVEIGVAVSPTEFLVRPRALLLL